VGRMTARLLVSLLVLGLSAAPLAAGAQPAEKVWRVGWLSSFGEPRPTFREALRELGYVEGKNVAFEARNADGKYDRIPEWAAELVRLKVDIIAAVAPAAIKAAKQATSSIPIVMAFWGGPDLIESGVIASFNRPGGNVTGVHMLAVSLDPKRLELLLQAVPAAKKVAILSQERALFEPQLPGLRKAAEDLGVQVHVVEAADLRRYEAAFESMARVGAEALMVPTSPQFARDRKLIIELAARRRMPAMYQSGIDATQGGLMSYGPSLPEMDRQAARFVDKILKGAKPADLPIEQPTKFELIVNLKTAKTLGLTIPPSFLLRADQVIE
jgi:putative ABC transport system substrate-binding protein